MPAYMELNGAACYLPSQLLDEAEANPHIDFCLADWEGKANAFHHRRGSLPSFGYLLCSEESVSSVVSSGLRIIYADGADKTFNVSIEWAKKITPAYFKEQGFYVVRVCDERQTLTSSLVGKRYNLVESFSPSQSSTEKGTFKYVKETLKEVSVTLSVPYSWADLFQEVFKLPSGQTLSTGGVTFPTYVPQDLDWRYTTRQEALECLLQWTGTTIVYQGGEQSWKLVLLQDVNGDNLTSLVSRYDSISLSKNRFPQYKKYGAVTPSKFKLHFRKLSSENAEIDEYQVLEKTPSTSPKSGKDISVRLPSYFVNDSSAPQDTTEIASSWLVLSERWLGFFPSQEKTYEGFLYNPPGDQGTAFPMIPSAFVETVIWFDIGDGAKTNLISASPREWVPRPGSLQVPVKDKTRIAVGRVVGNISPAQPTFVVNFLRSVVGTLPTTPNTVNGVFVNNTHQQQYSDGDTITIFSEEGSPIWDTDRSGAGSVTIRFQLKEDLEKTAFSTAAYVLDAVGNIISDPSGPLVVQVGNAWQIFKGYAQYDDPLYGDMPGYRGFAILTAANALGSIYQISSMEGQARWLKGKTAQEVIPDQTSFKAHVDKFWGAFPNDRPPKTEIIEEGTSQDPDVYGVRIYDELNLITDTIPEDSNYLAVYDEENDRYILTNIEKKTLTEKFGLLTANMPAANWTLSQCTHGYADAAVIVFSKQLDNDNDPDSVHHFKSDGGAIPGINPIWPTEIKAGQTTNEKKPVVVRGYEDNWNLGDSQKKNVFVITQVVYPLTIVKGNASGPVSGTGNFTINGATLLWGRDPKIATLQVANPEGWDGPAGALVYAMQIVDGTWLALYISCPN